MLILGTELGLRANCKVPQGSDMPRAPWSSFNIVQMYRSGMETEVFFYARPKMYGAGQGRGLNLRAGVWPGWGRGGKIICYSRGNLDLHCIKLG